MADRRNAGAALVDLLVYAPIGLAIELRRRYPGLVESGRKQVDDQVRLARFVGELAVGHVRNEVAKRLGGASREPEAIADAVGNGDGAEPPVVGYDDLSASELISRLRGLDREQLTEVADYETAHRARRTVLNRVGQLLG